MRKWIALLLALCLSLSLSGCLIKQPEYHSIVNNTTYTEPTTETVESVHQLPMVSVSLPMVTQEEKAENGTVIFKSLYQNMSLIGADPEVADKVIIDFLNRTDIQSTADSLLSQAKNAYSASDDSWTPYLCQISYNPVRIDQSVLSLYGKLVSYSGSAHPEVSNPSVTYDLLTGEVLSLTDILNENVTGDELCDFVVDQLNDYKDQLNLYPDFEQTVRDRFSKSLAHEDAWGLDNEGLRFVFSPYEIAPYSSGDIVARIAYSKLTGLLKDEYFPREKDDNTGAVKTEIFKTEKLAEFTQLSELVLTDGTDKVILYAEGLVYDLKIYTGSWNADGSSFNGEYAVFAANSLSPGDAIVIEDNFENELPHLCVAYSSEGERIERLISYDGEKNTVTLKEP